MIDLIMSPTTALLRSPFRTEENTRHAESSSNIHSVAQGLTISPPHSSTWHGQYGSQPSSQPTLEASFWETCNSFGSSELMQDVTLQQTSDGPSLNNFMDINLVETPRAKKKRAQQACSNCRKKKARCDENRPTCTQCLDTDMECVYQENKPAKKEEFSDMLKDIRERVMALEHSLSGYQSEEFGVEAGNVIRESIKPFLAQFNSGCIRCERMEKLLKEKNILTEEDAIELERSNTSRTGYDSSACLPRTPQRDPSASVQLASRVNLEFALSIPLRHSTPAHKLVESWKSIKVFYEDIADSQFLLNRELHRDSLRCSAQAAVDQQAFNETRGIPSRSSFSTENSEGFVHINPIETFQDHFTSPTNTCFPKESLHPNELERRRAKNLWKTYLTKFHVLHPFLDVNRIGDIIETLCSCNDPSSTTNSPIRLDTSPKNERYREGKHTTGGLKRKYAEDSQSQMSSRYSSPHKEASGYTENSIDTATVLLVLALGEIGQEDSMRGSTMKEERMKSFESAQSDFMTTKSAILFPAPPSVRFLTLTNLGLCAYDSLGEHRCTGISEDSSCRSEASQPQRLVPGLSYYCCAVELLGGLVCSSEMSFIHAKLLAGLYASQLLRPMEAWTSIREAALGMQTVLDLNTNVFDASYQDPWEDSIRVTYWTTLQLESDILAELDNFSPSGISRFETLVPPPLGPIHTVHRFVDTPIDMRAVMECYSQLVYLRRVLNLTHSSLYGSYAPTLESNIEEKIRRAEVLREQLDAWKRSLLGSEQLKHLYWDDSEPFSNDINIARMRAKYYGAQVIIHRPFLQFLLEHDQPRTESQSIRLSSDAAVISPSTIKDIESLSCYKGIKEAAKRCVRALVKSTEAFDGLPTMPKNLTVTNIFGTAQAQFGNMLVLGATQRSYTFQWLGVEREEFHRLLRRTIEFLRGLAPLSSTMDTNLEILLNMQKLLFN